MKKTIENASASMAGGERGSSDNGTRRHNLNDLLDAVVEERKNATPSRITAPEITLGEVISAIGARGYGPLLFLPGFLTAAPTGAIPGVAIGAAVITILIALQMVFSPARLWIPDRLAGISMTAAKVDTAVRWARPPARVIDRILAPRLEFLLEPPFSLLAAGACLIMGALTVPFAFIPFAAALPGLAIAAFGLALTSRDGAAILVAFIASAASLGLGGYLLNGF